MAQSLPSTQGFLDRLPREIVDEILEHALALHGTDAIAIHKSRQYGALIEKWRGTPPPENRLQGAMIAGPMMVLGAFWLGWTGNYPNVHWAAPAASLIIVGFSITLIFISFVVR